MKRELRLGWLLCLACSANGSDGSNPGDGPSDANGRQPDGQGMEPDRPEPGGAPVIADVAGGGEGVNLEAAEFPDIFGAGFAGTVFPSSTCAEDCEDFPAEPIVVAGGGPAIGQEAIQQFGTPEGFAAGNLCVLEPQLSEGDTPGALFPANWLRPRFRWAGGEGSIFELRLANEIEASDLVVYTRQTEWIMPKEIWESVARNVHTPITVTLRALDGGAVTGTQGSFQIAPVNAGGSLVFWATTTSEVRAAAQSQLYGFTVGDEGVLATLNPQQVEQGELVGEDGVEPRGTFAEESAMVTGFQNGSVACVGCHISTPDGEGVVFTDNWPWNKVVSSILEGEVGDRPSYVTDGAQLLLSQPWLGTQAMSPAHFQAGDRKLITSYGVAVGQDAARLPWDNQFFNLSGAAVAAPVRHLLAWFDLEAEVTVVDRSETPAFANNTSNENDNPDDDIDFPTTVAELQTIPPQNGPGNVRPRPLNRGEMAQFRTATVAAAQGTGWDLLATAGDARSAVTPDWSHDGLEIAYVSTDVTSSDGHPDWTANQADVRIVQYNDGAGGASAPLEGASSPDFIEYYPAFSSDDELIAFARAPNPSNPARFACSPANVAQCLTQNLGENPDGPYYNRNGEIHVVPRAGGAPVRLAANDPASCTGESSRGSINSWPKWSPRVVTTEGKTYYFLIFSSARGYPGQFELPRIGYTPPILANSSQLYMAALVVDEATGAITTHPAVYLWNQNRVVSQNGNVTVSESSNLTPAWDEFVLPPVVIQ